MSNIFNTENIFYFTLTPKYEVLKNSDNISLRMYFFPH